MPTGEVFWLPQGIEADCTHLQWTVLDGPGPNEVQTDDDGTQRFTPTAVGTYTFGSPHVDEELSLTTIDSQGVPFHNLMYLPSASMVEVDDEVWIAEAYAPRIARMKASNGKQIGAIEVGPWPVSLAWSQARSEVVVVQAAGDTLGVVDVTQERLVDSIWVGDEPVEVVLSPDGQTAYVSLATEDAVAVVDLQTRQVTERIDVIRDPRAMDIDEAGAILYIAGHRTGQPDRYPYGEDADVQTDIIGIDLESGEQVFQVEEAGNIITDLLVDDDQDVLFVSTTVSFPERGLTTLSEAPFEGQVQRYDLGSGSLESSTVLQPSDEESGFVLGPQGMARLDNSIWVVAEGSEVLVELKAKNLSEIQRIAVEGAPRFIANIDDDIWVHASQYFEVHRVSSSGGVKTTSTGTDPRPADVAAGALHFVRPGEDYGANFSCNSCHLEGRGDGRVWQAGPFQTWELTRSFAWLEGTTPLGWGGYVMSPRVFGYTGFASIINKWPDAQMAEELSSFASSIMPAPKANGWTNRDGSLSDAALSGEALYAGKAGCGDCHALPLTTNNVSFSEGVTPERSSTPSLVGAYRHNRWLKDGSSPTLRDAIVEVLGWTGKDSLNKGEIDDLTRYVQELTDRDFFLLRSEPGPDRLYVGSSEPIRLTFNQPVWSDVDNLSKIYLEDADGSVVPCDVTASGRHVSIASTSALSQGATYTIRIEEGLESYDQRALAQDMQITLNTAAAPSLHFEGTYKLLVQMPMFDLESNGFDRDTIVTLTNGFTATASDDGSDVIFDLSRGLEWDSVAIFDGADFEIPAQPVFLSQSLAQASAITGTGLDLDADGIADFASGSFTISGPGIWEEEIYWTIEPGLEDGACELGAAGDVPVSVTNEDGLLSIDWGDAGALGVYVTTYGATLPLGPGAVVTDGEAFWGIGTIDFPNGFMGPLAYGEVPEGAEDISEANGAPAGGADLVEGDCYQVSVISDAFQIGSWTLVY